MKAIFMTELGGRLMEVERREIEPRMVYYKAVREPISLGVIASDVTTSLTPKRERWVCVSRPIGNIDSSKTNNFAVFLLDCIE